MLNAEQGVRPLIALVQVEVPQAQCVFTSMLNSWYLVKDRHSKNIHLTQATGPSAESDCTSDQGTHPWVFVASIVTADCSNNVSFTAASIIPCCVLLCLSMNSKISQADGMVPT